MNCIIIHSDKYISFKFDKHKEDNTQVKFDKLTKKFDIYIYIYNTEDFYGQGYTLSVKEITYCLKYLKKGNFI